MITASEVRSAVVVLCLVTGIIVSAARNVPSGSAAADEAALGEQRAAPTKVFQDPTVVAPEESGDADAPDNGSSEAPPTVDSRGAQITTGQAGRTVALTFDDGPHPEYTPAVLEILRDYDIVATFCVIGTNAERHPELIRQIVEDGHTLCDHTVSHDVSLPDRDTARIEDEIAGTLASIHAAVSDADVPFYRAPGGHFATNVNEIAFSHGQVPLGWSIDPADWRRPGPRRIYEQVAEQVHPGAVILLHDGGGDRSGTVAALPRIIELLRDAGYEFVIPAS